MPARDKELQRPSSTYSGTVAGLFHSDSAAEDALEELNRIGFSQDEIGIVTSRFSDAANEYPHEGFWDKVAHLFGKSARRESSWLVIAGSTLGEQAPKTKVV